MNRYQEIEIDGKKLLSVEVEPLIRKGEDILGVDHANIDAMNGEQLVAYLTDLRRKYKKRVESDKLASQEQAPEMPEAKLPNVKPPERIATALTVKETNEQEQELDELIRQLRKVNRHWKIEWARRRNVPMKALLHAAVFWLSDDPDDWTAANDTIFAFTSHWGHKQLCYPRAEKVAIPGIASK